MSPRAQEEKESRQLDGIVTVVVVLDTVATTEDCTLDRFEDCYARESKSSRIARKSAKLLGQTKTNLTVGNLIISLQAG